MSRRRMLVVGAVALVTIGVGFALVTGFRTWIGWRNIDRVAFEPSAAREALTSPGTDDLAAPADTTAAAAGPAQETAPPLPIATPLPPVAPQAPAEYDSVLVIGSDERTEQFPQNQTGVFADAILLYLAPIDAGLPTLISVPRDLLVRDACSGSLTTIARTLGGCGDRATGPELVAIAVEDYSGIPVDHVALVNFDGLIGVIDAVGGVEICVDHALREGLQDLLPAGCSIADGATVLPWIRSRQTQEYVDGEWRFVEGVSDLSRTERQQDLLFALLKELKAMRAPTTLAAVVSDLGDALRLDDGFSMSEAIGMAWDLRGTPEEDFRRLTIPVEAIVTEDGLFFARPTMTFAELIGTG